MLAIRQPGCLFRANVTQVANLENRQLRDCNDDFHHAINMEAEVSPYFGELDKNITSEGENSYACILPKQSNPEKTQSTKGTFYKTKTPQELL